VVFPAYDSGKFYKNNEDVILKEKIEKLEKEQQKQDPKKHAEQKKKEKGLFDKLKSLSPYQSKNTRRYVIDRQSKKVLGVYADY
jgi:ribosome modulation factor